MVILYSYKEEHQCTGQSKAKIKKQSISKNEKQSHEISGNGNIHKLQVQERNEKHNQIQA